MIERLPDITALAALIGAFLASIANWRRPGRGLLVAAAVVVVGWVLLYVAVNVGVRQNVHKIKDRMDKEEQVSVEEQMGDGTGDRAAAILGGWFPGVVGMVSGSAVAYGLRRWLGGGRQK